MRGPSTLSARLLGWGGASWLILCALSSAAGEPAPAANRQHVRIDTADEVNLHGWFYPGKGKAACVLLLHDPAEGHTQADWEGVAQELQRLGLAVLTFDFRGHGESTGVGPGFWEVPFNRQQVRGYRPGKPSDQITRQDYKATYYPVLANDVAAARQYLDARNDAGECNTARLLVLGAGEGATLGVLWLASECSCFRALDTNPVRLSDNPEGRRTAAAVWLSLAPTLARRRVPVTEWLRQAGRKGRVPMTFLYGEEDATGAAFARHCLDLVEPRREDRKFTAAQAVRGTARTGTDLLGSDRPTTQLICKYVNNLLESTSEPEWQMRELEKQTYYWVFPNSRPELAKKKGEKTLRLLPQRALGFP